MEDLAVPLWDLLRDSPHRIDRIADFTHTNSLPMGSPNMMHQAGDRTQATDEKGLVILVDLPRIASLMFAVFRRVYPKTTKVYKIAPTVEQALKMIETSRQQSTESNSLSTLE